MFPSFLSSARISSLILVGLLPDAQWKFKQSTCSGVKALPRYGLSIFPAIIQVAVVE
jgi:hypothetical protein